MRFLSSSVGLKVPCIHDRRVQGRDNDFLLIAGYIAEFRAKRRFKPYEEKQAREQLTFRGSRTLLDEMTPVDEVLQRTGEFDTEWVPEDIREQVEDALLKNPFFGRDYILVEKPRLKPPWPGYAKIKTAQGKTLAWVAEQIASRVKDLELDVREVIDYERENENRTEVIDALEELLAVEPADDTIEIVV